MRDLDTSTILLRIEYLSQPPHIQAETRARALRLAAPGSALETLLRRGLHAPERAGELRELEARLSPRTTWI